MGHVVLSALAIPLPVDAGAFRRTGEHRSHRRVAQLRHIDLDDLGAQAGKYSCRVFEGAAHGRINAVEKVFEHPELQTFDTGVEARGVTRRFLMDARGIARIVAGDGIEAERDVVDRAREQAHMVLAPGAPKGAMAADDTEGRLKADDAT